MTTRTHPVGRRLDAQQPNVESQWLVRIVAIDLAAAATGVAMLALIYAVVLPRFDVLVAAAIVAGGGAAMSRALPCARRRDADAVVFWLALANWMTAILMTLVASFSWPLTVPAALIPAVLAATYTFGRVLRTYVAISTAVALAAASLGELRAGRGVSGAMPTWLSTAILIGWTPLLGTVIALIAHQNSARLRSMIAELTTSNARLEASRAELRRHADALQRSRARLVTATDAARRRIQRDLHDGAQQRLAALGMRIGTFRDRDGEVTKDELDVICDELRQAQVELRMLSSGMYPAVLTDEGPAAALSWATMTSQQPVRVGVVPTRRYDPDVEAAVYFCCLEAIQNATKHAGPAAHVDVAIDGNGRGIAFQVSDDGTGFDVAGVRRGLGWDDMHDRVEAIGGRLSIDSRPGRGTTVRGFVPAAVAS